MRELIRSFEEFKARADLKKPLHHSGAIISKGSFVQRLVFRIYGIDKDDGHMLIYEVQKASPLSNVEELQKEYGRLVDEFAKPLGSTEGAWLQ